VRAVDLCHGLSPKNGVTGEAGVELADIDILGLLKHHLPSPGRSPSSTGFIYVPSGDPNRFGHLHRLNSGFSRGVTDCGVGNEPLLLSDAAAVVDVVAINITSLILLLEMVPVIT